MRATPEPVTRVRTRRRWPARRVVTAVLLALLLALAGTAVGVAFYLRTYIPFGASSFWGPGPHTQPLRIVRAAGESGGKDVFYVDGKVPGTMTLAFDLENTARFPVRIDGLAHDMSTVDRYTDLVVLTRANVYSGRWTSFRPFTIQAGEFRTIGFKLTVPSESACAGGQVGTTAWSVANLRFSFLRVFHRTAFVDMPAVAALVCGKLPRPYDGGY